MNFFDKLDAKLVSKGMNKKELAEILDMPYQTFLWKYSTMRDYDHITLQEIIKISQIFGTSIGYWLDDEVKQEEQEE